MRFCVLGSGSAGNAIFVEGGDTRILIDAGFSGIEIRRRLQSVGVRPDSLTALLITHEHSDHICGAGILSRKFALPVHATQATLAAGAKKMGRLHHFSVIQAGTPFTIGGLAIHPYSISHDAADPVGFVLSHDGCSLGICTDTGVVSKLMRHRLQHCQALILECNHDPHLLKNGPYSQALQQRVRSNSGHLNNGEAFALLAELLHDGLRHVVLGHVSAQNNDRALLQELISEFYRTHLRVQGLPTRIVVADQETAGEMCEL